MSMVAPLTAASCGSPTLSHMDKRSTGTPAGRRKSPKGGRVSTDAFPPPPRLQLATFSEVPPGGDDWVHEIKFDGYRIAATVVDQRARLTTRNLLDWTHRFRAVADAVARLPARSAILDGEIVAVTASNRSDFAGLQHWLSRQTAGASADEDGADAGVEIVFQAFDLLYLNGLDLRPQPLLQRKKILEELLGAGSSGGSGGQVTTRVRYTEHLAVPGPEMLSSACRLGLEGIVSKRVDAPYRPVRNEDWLKSRCLAADEFIIGGFTHPRGSRTGLGALLLGEWDDDGRLRYVGKVGTGLDDATLAAVTARLRALARPDPPFDTEVPRVATSAGVTWVEPRLLAEVAYVDRTRAGMVRQARFHSLRDDKVVAGSGSVSGRRKRRPTLVEDFPEERSSMQVSGVTLSNPDRVLYPEQGITKERLARYYAEVSAEVLRWSEGRPLSLVRCPEGSEGQCFYQKHPDAAFAASLPRVAIEESDGVDDYAYLESAADLVALVQAGVLEIHVWNSKVRDLERPDMLVFDLDPSDDVDFSFTKATANRLKDMLERLGLGAFLRTTGGKGLHVVVPLEPHSDWDRAKAFARGVAELLASDDPERLTTNMSKQKRVGKLFIDYLRNGRGATAIANFSTRARLGAPVAVPLRWDELARLSGSNAYDIDSVRRRLTSLKSDPWEGFEAARRPLPTVEGTS